MSQDHAEGDYHTPTVDEVYPEIARVRRRNRTLKRFFAIVGAIVVALVCAGGAYGLWFFNSLDSALEPDEDALADLKNALVSTLPGEPFYMLVIGSDSREGQGSWTESERGDNEHSDVMILVRIDEKSNKLTLLSIPRDTPYKLPDGSYQKINEVYNAGGAAGIVKAVSALTGADISHYAEVHISGLQVIVDMLGGVEVDVPIKLSYETTDHKKVTVQPGRQVLDGHQAEIFARARHEYETEQDVHRQEAVRQLFLAIAKELLERPITEIPAIILQAAVYVDTDLKSGDIVSLALSFANNGDPTIYAGTGPTDGDFFEGADGMWLCYENPEGWKKVMEIMDAGGDPSGVDFSETSILWPAGDGAVEGEFEEAGEYGESSESSSAGAVVGGNADGSDATSIADDAGFSSNDAEETPAEAEVYE